MIEIRLVHFGRGTWCRPSWGHAAEPSARANWCPLTAWRNSGWPAAPCAQIRESLHGTVTTHCDPLNHILYECLICNLAKFLISSCSFTAIKAILPLKTKAFIWKYLKHVCFQITTPNSQTSTVRSSHQNSLRTHSQVVTRNYRKRLQAWMQFNTQRKSKEEGGGRRETMTGAFTGFRRSLGRRHTSLWFTVQRIECCYP